MDDKAWGDQDYVVAIWLLVSLPWFGLTAKMGMWYSWDEKIRWRREKVLWPGEFHGPYSPRGRKESDMTERLSLSHSL